MTWTVDVNSAVTLFTNILQNIFHRQAPLIKKKVKGKPSPWLDENIRPYMDRRDKLLRKARKSNSVEDWNTYKQLRNICTNLLRSAKRKYHHNLLNENRLNPKNFWKAIFPAKRKAKPSCNSSKSSTEKASNFFESAVYKLKKNSLKLIDFVWRKPKRFLNVFIHEHTLTFVLTMYPLYSSRNNCNH